MLGALRSSGAHGEDPTRREENQMTERKITRRHAIKDGAALAGAGALQTGNLAMFAQA